MITSNIVLAYKEKRRNQSRLEYLKKDYPAKAQVILLYE